MKKTFDHCDWSKNFFDLVITDVTGAQQIQSLDPDFYNLIKCKFRVIDRHGTDPAFNDDSIIPKSGLKNPLGGLDLPSLKQYLTLYPVSKENDWLGLISYPVEEEIEIEPKSLLVHARNQETITGNEDFLAELSKEYKLRFTVNDPNFSLKKYPKAENHGFLDHRDYLALMRSVQAVIGLGYPYEGPTSLEAISQGSFYLNPKFPKPKSRQNFIKNGKASLSGKALPQFASNYFQNLTTFRSMNTQNDFVTSLNSR